MYVPPLLEFFGLADLEHKLTGNRMKAVPIQPGASHDLGALISG